MHPDVPSVDTALVAVRALMRDAAASYKLVGGVAVVHHGHARSTVDIDLLLSPASITSVRAALSKHGFDQESSTRLRHITTGVQVDLLVGGASTPRQDAVYPMPDALVSSPLEPDVVGLAPLLELKLLSHRQRDIADVVELLKRVDDAAYLAVESEVGPARRVELASLRAEALEELRYER